MILPVFLGVVLFRSTIVTLRNGQLGAALLLAYCLTLFFWENGKWWQGALTLSFTFLKPTIGFPVAFYICVWLLLTKNWRSIIYLLLSGVAWLSIGWIQNINWVSLFLSNGGRKMSETINFSPNLWGLSSSICSQNTTCMIGLGTLLGLILSIGIMAILLTQKNLSTVAVFSLAIPTALLVTPYIWAYDHILLLFPILFVTSLMFTRGYPYIVRSLFPISMSILSIALLIVATYLNHDVLSMSIPLVTFCVVIKELLLPFKMTNKSAVVVSRKTQY